MFYIKRRIKDSLEITRELIETINWKNAIWTIPSMIFFIPLLWFLMLFEDYNEIDKHEKTIDDYLNNIK